MEGSWEGALSMSCSQVDARGSVGRGFTAQRLHLNQNATTASQSYNPTHRPPCPSHPQQFSASNDGAALLGPYLRSVVPALVTLITSPPGSQAPAEGSGGAPDSGVTLKACENASATLANISTTDPGIVACLEHQVPAAVVGLANRGLSGERGSQQEGLYGGCVGGRSSRRILSAAAQVRTTGSLSVLVH